MADAYSQRPVLPPPGVGPACHQEQNITAVPVPASADAPADVCVVPLVREQGAGSREQGRGGSGRVSEYPPISHLWAANHNAGTIMRLNFGIKAGLITLLAAIPVAVVIMIAMRPPRLGPKDGEDLPRTELDRVKVGDLAPDFSLLSYSGDIITLSDYRGDKNVVLVFYRGHW